MDARNSNPTKMYCIVQKKLSPSYVPNKPQDIKDVAVYPGPYIALCGVSTWHSTSFLLSSSFQGNSTKIILAQPEEIILIQTVRTASLPASRWF